MAARKKQAKTVAKKKEVKATRRKTHQKGLVTTSSKEMKAQRKQADSKKVGERKQRDVKDKGLSASPGRAAPRAKAAKKVVRRVRKPSSATTTPAPADAGMPASLSELGGA
jgi:hypothetical protein